MPAKKKKIDDVKVFNLLLKYGTGYAVAKKLKVSPGLIYGIIKRHNIKDRIESAQYLMACGIPSLFNKNKK